MNKTRFLFCATLVALFFFSCTPGKRQKTNDSTTNDTVQNGIVKSYYERNLVRAEIPYKDGKKNGVAKEYYKTGKLFQEITYTDGLKNGTAKRFYENGKAVQLTDYVMGKMHGKQKKYRLDGKPSSEAVYFQDEPCKGLVEYTLDGSLKQNHPSIVITPINSLLKDNRYILRLSVSGKFKVVEFFTGTLSKEGCISSSAKQNWSTDKNGVAELEYYLPPGGFMMEKINVIAKIKTVQGNYLITQRSYNLAIENK